MAPIESSPEYNGSEWKKVEHRKKKPAKRGESNPKAEETEKKKKKSIKSESEKPKAKAEAASNIESEPRNLSLAEAASNMESKPRNLSLAEAASKIEPSHLAAYLAESRTWFPGSELLKLVDYFGEALSGVCVSSVQFPWPDMDKLFPLIDHPVRHFPRPVYKIATDWISKVPFKIAIGFIVWSFDFIRRRMVGSPTPPKSDLTVFVVLAMVLRYNSHAYAMILEFLRMEPFSSEALLPVTVWMMAQVTQVDVCLGFYSWANNLLPLAGDKHYYRKPKSTDLVLQLVEAILSYPNAPAILESDKVHEGVARLISPSQFEILLRLTFPPSYARPKDTERFEAIYPLLKELALADTPRKEATRQLTLEIFTFSLKLAGEGNRVLAKEAKAIAIWCLTKNVYCCNHWDNVYEENPKASVALLKKIVGKGKYHSHKLSSSWRDTPTVNRTMKSFMLKNKKQITQGGANASLFQEADKYCKEISRGSGFLKGIAIGSLYKEANKYCKEISRRSGFLKGIAITLSRGSVFFKSIAITAFVVLVAALLQTYSIRIRIERR